MIGDRRKTYSPDSGDISLESLSMAESVFVIPLNQVSISARLANWTIKPCSVESNISASSRIRRSRPSDAFDGDIMGNTDKSIADRRVRDVRRVPTHNLRCFRF